MTQITMGEVTPEYQAFVDKLKRKLTTDDCYTPPLVYEAVAERACAIVWEREIIRELDARQETE